jgi:hypothetical protein
MSRKWTLKYGFAAVFIAITIIAVALFVNPMMFNQTSNQTSAAASFVVMLTDPPTVPAGTTILDLTYSNVSLHVTYPNGTADWLSVNASGTVNLFTLINMSQTIASTTIPTGSAVDKIQFTIVDVDAVVHGVMYNVTTLSDTLVVSVKNSRVNETLSGVLIDFNPTLVQIQATDVNGTLVYYYVLVPSATAIIIGDLSKDQIKVGTIVEIGENNRAKIVHVVEEFSNNVTIANATLSVNGNVTTLSVTLKNEGNVSFRVFGLTLHGEFNATRTWSKTHGDDMDEEIIEKIHPETIPFKVNGSSLVPLFGDQDHEHDDEHKDKELSSLTLLAGETVTLNFSDVIALQPEKNFMKHPAIVVTPIVGGNYTVRLMGEGFQTFNLTATS